MNFIGRARWWWCAVFLGVLAQGALVLGASAPGWFGWLPAATSDFERTSLWGASITASAAAIVAGSVRAHGAQAWVISAGRSFRDIEFPAVRLVASASSAALTALAGVVFFLSLRFAPLEAVWRFALTWLAVLGIAVCAATFGAVLAQVISAWVAPVVAFIVPWLIVVLPAGYLGDGVLSAVLIPNFQGYDYVWAGSATVLARAGTAVVCGVLAMAYLRGWRRTLAATRAVASLSLVATIFTAGDFSSVPAAEQTQCTGNSPIVCFDGSQRAALPEVTSMLRREVPHLPAASRPRKVILTDALPVPEAGVRLVPANGKYQPARRLSQTSLASQLGDNVFRTACASPAAQSASVSLLAWWRQRLGVPMVGVDYAGQPDLTFPELNRAREEGVRWAGLPTEQQSVEVQKQAVVVASCQ